MVYCTSRLLFGMATQGDAPAFLGAVNKRGVPTKAILLPACLTASCVLLNFLMPASIIEMLIALVTATLIITWGVITITHLRFRSRRLAFALQASSGALLPNAPGTGTAAISPTPGTQAKPFRAPWQPWSNYACLAFMAGIVIAMLQRSAMSGPALAIPIWLTVLYVFYRVWDRPRRAGSDRNAQRI
jgi:L-asparagine transporter-like permease